jgi:hypothetical protein
MGTDDRENALVLVRLGEDAGGRVDPGRILRRSATSRVRGYFLRAQDEGWLDGEGWVTDAGREALRDA